MPWGEYNHLPVCSPFPPWSSIDSFIKCTLPVNTKNSSKDIIKAVFRDVLCNNYSNCLEIYTDGSMLSSPVSCASALYIPEFEYSASWKLSDANNIVTAELFAILKALQFVVKFIKGNDVIILTDSQVSLSLLKGYSFPFRIYIEPILASISSCMNKGINVFFQWIPSHCSILGNETVDSVAREAHNLDLITKNPIPVMEDFHRCRKGIERRWLLDREASLRMSHLGKVRKKNIAAPLETGMTNRLINVAILRLRIGHTSLNYHLHRLRLVNSSLCEHCGEEETISHVLVRCPRYFSHRTKFIYNLRRGGIRFEYDTILGKEEEEPCKRKFIFRHLAVFLKDTGLINRL